jgi:hypothetical protein
MGNRHEDPRDEGEVGNEGVPDFPTGPGFAPIDLTPEEREEFLTLVRGGFGVNMALHQMRIGRYRFYRILKEDPEFRSEVEHARAFDREYLFFLRRKLAVGDEEKDIPPDPAGLEFLIRQGAAAERFGWERREAARTRRDAKSSGGVAKQVRVKIEYDEPDDRLHRPDDPPATPAAPGPEDGP